ncbi:MAG: AAA family ATPase, partial [Nitrospinae bacterium]|nr:AAA family ATPase [Nitrospinota bacterium]
MRLLKRKIDKEEIKKRLAQFPVTAILGPRQCGKTTLARQFPFGHYFDLENPRDAARLDQPQLALENLSGLIVIDEIQRAPGLFPLIRYLVDNKPKQKYLVLGSASLDLLQQSSE